MKRNILKKLTAAAVLLFLQPVTASLYYAGRLADSYYVSSGSELRIASAAAVTAEPSVPAAQAAFAGSITREAKLRLFGILPIKTVSMHPAKEVMLVPCGQPFGVRMLMDGVMVIGFGEIAGSHRCPAAEAGLQEGDILREVDHVPLTCTEDLRQAAAAGGPLLLTVERDGTAFEAELTPVYSAEEHCYQTGVWVRDSTAGIGTMTYYEPETGTFGGLGHPICDADTGEPIPLASGEADAVVINGVIPGVPGNPGCLEGYFAAEAPIGTLQTNSRCGIFGRLTEPPDSQAVPLGHKQDIVLGEATMLTTVSGTEPQPYTVEIIRLDFTSETQNMVIEVTDDRLLAETGGIVQGMSGSPLLQNGRLIGAVTHVFVGDPTKGYGIFADSMYYGTGA